MFLYIYCNPPLTYGQKSWLSPSGYYRGILRYENGIYLTVTYTDKTILEISMDHIYDNGSKFAVAFQSVKGVNPAQYRNEVYRKSQTIQTEPVSTF